MIPRAGGDHQERDAMLGGDGGHQGLRAVATGDAEQVSAPGDGLARHVGDIDGLRPGHQEHLRAQVFGPLLQVELRHLPAAGLGIHDEVRMPGGRLRRVLGHAPVRDFPGQRRTGGHEREQPRGGRCDRHPQQVLDGIDDKHDDRRQHEHGQRQPAHDPSVGKEEERGGQARRRGHQPHAQHREAAQPGEHRHDHDRHDGEHETQPGQPPLRGRALRERRGRHRRTLFMSQVLLVIVTPFRVVSRWPCPAPRRPMSENPAEDDPGEARQRDVAQLSSAVHFLFALNRTQIVFDRSA